MYAPTGEREINLKTVLIIDSHYFAPAPASFSLNGRFSFLQIKLIRSSFAFLADNFPMKYVIYNKSFPTSNKCLLLTT